MVDRGMLPIRTNPVLSPSPQTIHCIYIRAFWWQPNQFDGEVSRRILRCVSGMPTCLIEQHCHLPLSVLLPYKRNKGLKVNRTCSSTGEEDALSGLHVDSTVDCALCILP